jgi:hypothetical protein
MALNQIPLRGQVMLEDYHDLSRGILTFYFQNLAVGGEQLDKYW